MNIFKELEDRLKALKEEKDDSDIVVAQGIASVVVAMTNDAEIPIEVREKYRQLINRELKIITLLSIDWLDELNDKI